MECPRHLSKIRFRFQPKISDILMGVEECLQKKRPDSTIQIRLLLNYLSPRPQHHFEQIGVDGVGRKVPDVGSTLK